jgi:hypothetical protein
VVEVAGYPVGHFQQGMVAVRCVGVGGGLANARIFPLTASLTGCGLDSCMCCALHLYLVALVGGWLEGLSRWEPCVGCPTSHLVKEEWKEREGGGWYIDV